MSLSNDVKTEYCALTEAAGLARLDGETLIEVSGDDRATFLHNLSTNDVRRLEPGQGCELFLTDVRGKTLGHGVVLCGPDSLVLATVPAQADRLLAHLDRYLIREDVQLIDRSEDWSQLLLAGPQAAEVLMSCLDAPIPAGHLEHIDCELKGHQLNVMRTGFYGTESFVLRSNREDCVDVAAAMAASTVACSAASVDVIRIETGTPRYGVDIGDDNLPQEVDRDDRAISFTKGCYLGQETVARIDALGHVNRKLCGVRFETDVISGGGLPLNHGEQTVGSTASATFSPRLGRSIALAYLKRGYDEPGTQLDSEAGPAEVVRLPFA
jgi:folate-binding protein YgfZ